MNENSISEFFGACVCGAISFVATGPAERITVCHCTWCQRRTGTAFGVEAVFLEDNVNFSGPKAKSYRHHSDESNRWLDMHFCESCGTNLGMTLEIRAGIRSIPAGIFDDPTWIESSDIEIRHVYTRSRRHWGELFNAVETHEAYFE